MKTGNDEDGGREDGRKVLQGSGGFSGEVSDTGGAGAGAADNGRGGDPAAVQGLPLAAGGLLVRKVRAGRDGAERVK